MSADILDILMFAALVVGLLSGAPVAFTLAGVALAFAGLGLAMGVFDTGFVQAFPSRVFGAMTNQALTAVPLFVLMGALLERSRLAEDLLCTMGDLLGRARGGLLYATVAVGALLAASTGVVGATVVTMGLLSLPAMLARGYSPALSSGAIAAAGTLGQIIPPSIVLILLGDVIGVANQRAQLAAGEATPRAVSVGDLFAGALIPGLLLVLMYLALIFALVRARPALAPPGPAERPSPAKIAEALGAPLVLILAVLGSILLGVATPTEGAAVGALGALLLAGWRHAGETGETRSRSARLIAIGGGAALAFPALRALAPMKLGAEVNAAGVAGLILAGALLAGAGAAAWRLRAFALPGALRSTAEITAMVFTILIGAALFSLVFRGLGGDEWIASMFQATPGGLFGALLLVNLIIFLLGFFIDFIEICFVVIPLVAPPLLILGADPVWLGVMLALNLQTSFLTPPFGFALFYLRGVAPKAVQTLAIYRGVIPFILLQIAAIGVVAAFPALATWLPRQLYE